MLAVALRAIGHTVWAAEDAALALKQLESCDPEIALLDIGLPVMDGYELAERIHNVRPRTVLIALTAYGRDGDRDRARRAGFAHHIVKPVDLTALSEVFASVPTLQT